MRDGSRRVTNITEVNGMEGDVITTMDIFVFEQTGFENGKVLGRLRPSGLRPKFMGQSKDVTVLPLHINGWVLAAGTNNVSYLMKPIIRKQE